MASNEKVRVESCAGAVEIERSGIPGHVVLRVDIDGQPVGLSLRADEWALVEVAARRMLAPRNGPITADTHSLTTTQVATAQHEAETCRCPNRPRFPSWGHDSAAESAAMRKWEREHGHHDYAKARDTLAQALEYAEGSVSRDEQWKAGEAVLDMVADVYGQPRPSEPFMKTAMREALEHERQRAAREFKSRLAVDMLAPPPVEVAAVASDEFMRHEAGLAGRCTCSARGSRRMTLHEDFCLMGGGNGVRPTVIQIPLQDLEGLPPTELVSQVASEMKAAHDANGSPTEQE